MPSESQPMNDSKIADFDAALARLDGNRKLLKDMIGFFREDVPQLLDDIDSALSRGDAPKVKRAAHSIKGLASNFEAEQVTSRALQIEQLAENSQLDEIPRLMLDFRAIISELEEALLTFETDAS